MNKIRISVPIIMLVAFSVICLAFAADYKYVGSSKSNKYHYTTCQWAVKIKSENLVTSQVLHEAQDKSMKLLIEKEKELWLNAELMRREAGDLTSEVTKMDDLMKGNYVIVEAAGQESAPPVKQVSTERPTTIGNKPKPKVISRPIKECTIF